ncbi:unnamed protein product [Phaedon cochleariae]|uniref:Ubiquitin-like protease family profile domain-containing protein n=1 Tax=Phaedon cochleariae TaxID=80249 RepID=A0A9N9SAN8_PHACE|nr:unnamed protein product [Phaedon cochleariae]
MAMKDLLGICCNDVEFFENEFKYIEPPEAPKPRDPLYKVSPFYRLFKMKYNTIKRKIKNQERSGKNNKFFNEKYLLKVLRKYVPFLPLWTSLISGKRQSNAPVENWFSVVKHLILEELENQKTSRVIRLIRRKILAVHKEITLNIPKRGCTSRRSKRRSDIDKRGCTSRVHNKNVRKFDIVPTNKCSLKDLSAEEQWKKQLPLKNNNFKGTILKRALKKIESKFIPAKFKKQDEVNELKGAKKCGTSKVTDDITKSGIGLSGSARSRTENEEETRLGQDSNKTISLSLKKQVEDELTDDEGFIFSVDKANSTQKIISIQDPVSLSPNEEVSSPFKIETAKKTICFHENGLVCNLNYYKECKGYGNYVVAKFHLGISNELKFEDFKTLFDKQWLTDFALNYCLRAILNEHIREHTTEGDYKLLNTDQTYAIFYHCEHIVKEFFDDFPDISESSIVILPIIIGTVASRNHWVIAFVNFQQSTFTFIDPRGKSKLNALEFRETFEKFIEKPLLLSHPFRKWELHMLPSLTTSATNGIWAVKTSSFLESPRYCIVCFQTDHDLTEVNTDPTIFNHANITNITLTLNGESYPKEKMQLAFDKGAFPQAYFKYTRFGYRYKNTSQHTPLLGYPEFANKQPLFVIDCSRRDESVKSSTVDVKLEIEASQGFPANTRAYCIIIHDNIIEHLPLSEFIKKWN